MHLSYISANIILTHYINAALLIRLTSPTCCHHSPSMRLSVIVCAVHASVSQCVIVFC